MKIMTYNILNDNPGFANLPKKNWRERGPHLLKLITGIAPDILAIQEGTPIQVEQIQQELPSHSYYGIGSMGNMKGEQVGIYYNKNIFEPIYSETFWLSNSPQKLSKDWNSSHFRICSYVQLKHSPSQQIYFLFNTHLDHKSEEARLKGIELILSKIQMLQVRHPEARFILTGDFNAHPKTPLYQKLIESSLKDSYQIAKQHSNKISYTFTGVDAKWTKDKILLHIFYPQYMHKRLDYIFVSENTMINHHTICKETYHNKYYPSDHLPIIIDIKTN